MSTAATTSPPVDLEAADVMGFDALAGLSVTDLLTLAHQAGLDVSVLECSPFAPPGADLLVIAGGVDQVSLIVTLCRRAGDIIDELHDQEFA